MIRAVYWTKDGGYLKYMDVRKLEQIDGIWVATELHIATKKGKQTIHQTVLRLHHVKFNCDLSYDLFSNRSLEKGL